MRLLEASAGSATMATAAAQAVASIADSGSAVVRGYCALCDPPRHARSVSLAAGDGGARLVEARAVEVLVRVLEDHAEKPATVRQCCVTLRSLSVNGMWAW